MAYVPNVLIFGHSFIKRLKHRTEAEPLNFKPDLNLRQCNVVLKGFGGLNLGIKNPAKKRYFYTVVDELFRYSEHDILICQLGGNDISYDTSPRELADAIIEFGQYVRDLYRVKIVYVCSVFTRHKPRGISAEDYEKFRVETNVLLEKYTQTDDGITFWLHKRIFNSPHYLFVEDGTHLNDIGTKKLYKSLRQASIFAVEKYQSK